MSGRSPGRSNSTSSARPRSRSWSPSRVRSKGKLAPFPAGLGPAGKLAIKTPASSRVVYNGASNLSLLTYASKTGKRVATITYHQRKAELDMGAVTATSMAKLLADERAQDERTLQSALGKAIQESFQTIVEEPLPGRIGLLLLQLALEKVITPRIGEAPCGDVLATMDEPHKLLATATRHVVEAERIVARQRERIVRLQAVDCPIEDALQVLNIFMKTLAVMKDHQRLLREEAEGKDSDAGWLFSRVAARTPATPQNFGL